METFLWIYIPVQIICLLWWLGMMIFNKPLFGYRKSKFMNNWDEGGHIILFVLVFASIAFAVSAAKLFLWLNFLEAK